MGMEIVSFIMDVENEFDVTIQEDDAWQMQTPRDVINYHYNYTEEADRPFCPNLHIFYRLRQAAVALGICQRNDFQLDAQLKEMLPAGNRRQAWRDLRERVGDFRVNTPVRWPGLERPGWLVWLLVCVGCLMSLQLALQFSSFWLFPICLSMYAIIGAAVTRPHKVLLPAHAGTPRSLVQHISYSYLPFLTREEIADRVRSIVLDICGEVDYREDGHFYSDLGFD